MVMRAHNIADTDSDIPDIINSGKKTQIATPTTRHVNVKNHIKPIIKPTITFAE
jgi:hypothetical protein